MRKLMMLQAIDPQCQVSNSDNEDASLPLETKTTCTGTLSSKSNTSVGDTSSLQSAAASLPLGEKETRLMGAEWGPLRLKATDQDRRSNMETSLSVPGTANRLPPSGCQAVPLRLAEVTSTWTHHACHIAHACPSHNVSSAVHVLHSESARASYVLATVKMMMLQNGYLAWDNSVRIAGVGQSERVLTHAAHAWHTSVGCVTDIGYICDQLSIV